MKKGIRTKLRGSFLITASFLMLTSAACTDDDTEQQQNPGTSEQPILLVIDEDAIDNGNPPNNFSAVDVNDQDATVGYRKPLEYFTNHIGETITLYSGEVGDEAFFALKTIPDSWKSAGPTANGAENFLKAGPGLGTGDDPEILLDEISDVTPLRATGLAMLKGKTILAIVYDSDISINYGPLEGNLQGANLGIVSLTILDVDKRTDGSSMSLPKVQVRIENVETIAKKPLYLFSNAPVPRSSSEPGDIDPPNNPDAPTLAVAP